ncbi:MAG: hypothetical protein AAFU34_15525 [Pseudomonadota bacterium]
MTVPVQPTRITYPSPAAGVPYALPWTYQTAGSHQLRYLLADGTKSAPLADTEYSVSPGASASPGEGALTLLQTPPANASELIIDRAHAIVQLYRPPPQNDPLADQLDRLTLVQQETSDRLDSLPTLPVDLPEFPQPQAGQFLQWSSAEGQLRNTTAPVSERPVYRDLPDLQAALTLSSTDHLVIQGEPYVRDDANGIIDVPGVAGGKLRPANGRLNLGLVFTAQELIDDFKGRFIEALDYCVAQGLILYIPPAAQPYRWSYIDHTVADTVVIECHPAAQFEPIASFQDFACDGVTDTFVCTFFPNELGYDPGVTAMYFKADGSYQVWSETSDPATSPVQRAGKTVTLPRPGAIDETCRIAHRSPAITLRGASMDVSIFWIGGDFEMDQRGYIPTAASGSCLGFRNCAYFSCTNMRGRCTNGGRWWDPLADQRMDSWIVPTNVLSGYVGYNRFEGSKDLDIYISGEGSVGFGDNGGSIVVENNVSIEPSTFGKSVRQFTHALIANNFVRGCKTFWLNGITSGLPSGLYITAVNNVTQYCALRMFDLRDMKPGSQLTGNLAVDPFRRADGSLYDVTDFSVVRLAASSGIVVQGQRAIAQEYPKVPGGVFAKINGEENTGVSFLGCTIVGIETGFWETGGVTNDFLQIGNTSMHDVDTPFVMPAQSPAEYDVRTYMTQPDNSVLNGSLRRVEGQLQNARQQFLPEVAFQNMGDAVIAYVVQEARASITGEDVFVSGRLDFRVTWSATPPSGYARVINNLPYAASVNGGGDLISGNATVPADIGDASLRIFTGRTSAEIYVGSPTGSTAITAADFVTAGIGTLISLVFNLTYKSDYVL